MTSGQGDVRIARIIGILLRVGVLVAACMAATGGVWFLVQHGGETSRYGSFHGEPDVLRSVVGVIKGVAESRSDAVIQLGLILLIAVPLLRVAVSLVAFAAERDWLYALVTFLVLSILLFSLLSGMA
jgi:uncharacterized membrane protein